MVSDDARAARKLLGWSQLELAHKAGLALETVAHFEARPIRTKARTKRAIQEAFEAAGIEFSRGEPPRLKSDAIKQATWEQRPTTQ